MSFSKFIPYIAAGGCAAVLIIVCVIWYCYRRSRRLRYKEFSEAFAARDQTLQYDDEFPSRTNPTQSDMSPGQVTIDVKDKSFISPKHALSALSKLKPQKGQSSDQYSYSEFNPFESPNYDNYTWKTSQWGRDYEPIRTKLDSRFTSPQKPRGDSYAPDLDVTGDGIIATRNPSHAMPHSPISRDDHKQHNEQHSRNLDGSMAYKNTPPIAASASKHAQVSAVPGSATSYTHSPQRKNTMISETGMSSHKTVASHTSSSSTVRLGKHQLDYMNKQLESKSLYGSSSRKTSKYGSQSRYSSSSKHTGSQFAQIPSSRGLLREDGSYVSAVAESKTNLVKSQLMKKAQARNQS